MENKWLPLKCYSDDTSISAKTVAIHCDTRDFFVNSSEEEPELYEKAYCNLEKWSNEGILRLYKLFSKENRQNYSIQGDKIIPWLKELCEKTGGYDREWRCIVSNVKDCTDWNIKYIRFVRNPKCDNEFIVCNSYFKPIKYKEIIENINYKILG